MFCIYISNFLQVISLRHSHIQYKLKWSRLNVFNSIYYFSELRSITQFCDQFKRNRFSALASCGLKIVKMSSKPILYYMTVSPPSRAVLMVAAALDIELELKTINLLAMEHLTPEYLSVTIIHFGSSWKPFFQMFSIKNPDKSPTHHTSAQRQRRIHRRQSCDCCVFVWKIRKEWSSLSQGFGETCFDRFTFAFRFGPLILSHPFPHRARVEIKGERVARRENQLRSHNVRYFGAFSGQFAVFMRRRFNRCGSVLCRFH